MSLLPYLLDIELAPHHHHPIHHRLMDQHFGLGFSPHDSLTAAVPGPTLSREYNRPWRHIAAAAHDLGSSIKYDKDKFQVILDVQHFAPEEISVKTADGYIIVEGKHEEKQDPHGFVSRQFVRRYALPENTSADTVQSKLSSDGVLSITAPKKLPLANKGERPIPIQQTGPIKKVIKDDSAAVGQEK